MPPAPSPDVPRAPGGSRVPAARPAPSDRSDQPTRSAQSARALVLALVASGAATVAHAVGGGHLVSATSAVVATLVLAGLALPFVRHEPTTGRTVTLLALLQVGGHVVHSLAALVGGPATTSVTGGHAHGADASALSSATTGQHAGHGSEAAVGVAGLLPSPVMLLAHVLAAVAVGSLLAAAERSWRLTSRLLAVAVGHVAGALERVAAAAALLAGVLSADAGAPARATSAPPARRRPHDVWCSPSPARRGPPRLLSV
ncbi:hypothetical protein DFJ68_3564 [Terracoccus luteus]|uniref:Uncharacterized protein n=1 Tax=Terracoccus luteus TaxID=53356 RepID=A0A495Y3H1_9MICO|nr:hypothetical protein [Terracoccus luteus]RKT80085.1 hypothetical protein DFJ68_3564 [Terracoccus luteus]